jgi:hypothetical protein
LKLSLSIRSPTKKKKIIINIYLQIKRIRCLKEFLMKLEEKKMLELKLRKFEDGERIRVCLDGLGITE